MIKKIFKYIIITIILITICTTLSAIYITKTFFNTFFKEVTKIQNDSDYNYQNHQTYQN